MAFSIEPFVTSNIPLLSALLFIAGVCEDVLATWVTFSIVKRQTITTAILTFVSIIIEFTVFLSFISNLDKWPVIICYAVGATVGSVGVVELQKRATRKKTEQQKEKRTVGARKKRLKKLRAERVAKRDVKKGFAKLEEKKPEVKPVEKVQSVEKKTPKIEKKVEKDETPISTTKSHTTSPSV